MQIAALDLDVAVLGQLPMAHLALGDPLEPGAVQVVCLDAAFRRHRAVDEAPEDVARKPHYALVSPTPTPNSTACLSGF